MKQGGSGNKSRSLMQPAQASVTAAAVAAAGLFFFCKIL